VIDIRLVFPALSAWGAAGLSLWLLTSIDDVATRHDAAVGMSVVAVIAIVVALVVCWRRAGVLVALAGGLVALVSVGVHVAAWSAPALQASMGSDVVVRGHIDAPARSVIGVTYLPMRSFLVLSDHAVHIDVPITVAIPEGQDGFTAIAVGTPVEVTGRLRPAGNSLRTAGYLDATAADIQPTGQAPVIDRLAERVRSGLRSSLPQNPASGAALVAGLAIGDETSMSPRLIDAMRESGLAHLTAVSGGNVAIVVGVILGLAWLLRLALAVRIAVALVALGFYVVLVHPQPSVLRAGVMGAVVVLSLLVGGRRPGPSVLAVAVIVLVVTVPSLALSWGFALSVAATAGIVMWAPRLRRWIENSAVGGRLPAAVTVGASVTLAAQVATAPVLIAMGVSVGLAAVPANLLAMPVVPLVTIAGLVAAVVYSLPALSAVTEPVAEFIAWGGAWAGEWIAQVAFAAGSVRILRFSGSAITAVIAVAVIAGALIAWRTGLRALVIACACVLAFTGVLWSVFPPSGRSWPPPDWVMAQCDVGQGDGFVIATDSPGEAVVVDTGRSARDIDSCLTDLGVDRVALIVLTHFHADHVAGLAGILQGRDVAAVAATGWAEPEAQYLGVQRVLRERGMEMRVIGAGARFTLGGGDYRVLWPRRFITSGVLSSGSIANNASVVLDVRAHGLRVLLTGDIEPPAQAAILAESGGFDLVKIPHHGSVHQHPEFARWADADAAVVSVGAENEFGHPAPATVQAWRESGAAVLRTDLHGDIAIVRGESAGGGWAMVPRNGPIE